VFKTRREYFHFSYLSETPPPHTHTLDPLAMKDVHLYALLSFWVQVVGVQDVA
jgi:hypothetical protein